MKAAIVVLSDPKAGSEEALGRVFNALAAAYDVKQAGDEVTVQFQGAGTRWIGELTKADHAAHALFEAVKDNVAGVSSGCADVFGGCRGGRESRASTSSKATPSPVRAVSRACGDSFQRATPS